MSFRFLHLADLHLETAFGGRRESTRRRLRESTREAFSKAVDHALEHELHAVLAAGDPFDEGVLSTGTERFLFREVRRLAEGGVWFLACAGNHDPGADDGRLAQLGFEEDGEEGARGEDDWRRRVKLFRQPSPERIQVVDRAGAPVAWVVGAGHAGPAESSNLAASFPKAPGSLPCVGLLHTQVASARRSEEHARYAPSTPEDFARPRYEYWALGHVHLRQRATAVAPAWYAGNLQGRNPRETGPKGGLEVEVRHGADVEPIFRRFAAVRWIDLTEDGLEGLTLEGLTTRLAERLRAERQDGEELCVRFFLEGPSPLARRLRHAEDTEAIEDELAESAGVLEVTLDVSGLRPPVDEAAIAASPTVLAEALGLVSRLAEDDALLAELAPPVLAGERTLDALHEAERGPARQAYLRGLLHGLEAELCLRTLRAEEEEGEPE